MALTICGKNKTERIAMKLTLIRLLSDPDIKVLDVTAQNEFRELPPTSGWRNWELTGKTTITINIFRKKDDKNSRVKKSGRKTKGKKRSAHDKFGY